MHSALRHYTFYVISVIFRLNFFQFFPKSVHFLLIETWFYRNFVHFGWFYLNSGACKWKYWACCPISWPGGFDNKGLCHLFHLISRWIFICFLSFKHARDFSTHRQGELSLIRILYTNFSKLMSLFKLFEWVIFFFLNWATYHGVILPVLVR